MGVPPSTVPGDKVMAQTKRQGAMLGPSERGQRGRRLGSARRDTDRAEEVATDFPAEVFGSKKPWPWVVQLLK